MECPIVYNSCQYVGCVCRFALAQSTATRTTGDHLVHNELSKSSESVEQVQQYQSSKLLSPAISVDNPLTTAGPTVCPQSSEDNVPFKLDKKNELRIHRQTVELKDSTSDTVLVPKDSHCNETSCTQSMADGVQLLMNEGASVTADRAIESGVVPSYSLPNNMSVSERSKVRIN